MNTLFLPTKIVFGYDCVKTFAGADLKKIGKKCLIVTGKNSAKISGALDDVVQLLQKNNIEYSIFDGISENPEFTDIFAAVEEFKKNDCRFVAGIGGGSPIDAAKAVAIISANDFKNKEIYNASLIIKSCPIVAIPTTAGSGTEVTPFSVLSDKETKIKAGAGHPFLFPVISFVDPQYTFTSPELLTRDSGLDALSHLLEGIYSNRRNRLIYPIISEGIKLIFNNLKKCIDEPQNKIARENLSLASLYGGMTIAQTSTTLQHSIGYPLTARLGLSHGAANAVVMRKINELFYPHIKTEFDDILKCAGLSKNELLDFVDSFEIPPPRKFECDIEAIVKQVLNSRNMANNPISVSYEDIISLYK